MFVIVPTLGPLQSLLLEFSWLCLRDNEVRSELEAWNVKCETITTVEQMRSACRLSACTPRNRRCQRRHWCRALWSACWCTRRSSFTCDAVVLIHFVLTAVYRSHCFHVEFP